MASKKSGPKDKNVQVVKSTDLFEKIYRGLATLLVRLLVKTPVTGNMVSVFRGILFVPFCVLIGIYPLIGFPAWAAYLIMFLGIQIWDVLDCADGQLARAKKMAGSLGEWMEMFIDRPLGNLGGLFGFCLALGLWFALDSVWVWVFLFMNVAGWWLKTSFVHIDSIMAIPEQSDVKWRKNARKTKESYIGKVLFFFHYRELGVFSICALLFLPVSVYLGINLMFWYLLLYALLHNMIWLGIAFIQYLNLRKTI